MEGAMASKSTRDTGTFSFTVEPLELKNLFSLLSALPKEVQAEVRDSAQVMSKRLAGQLIQFGLASRTPQAKLVIESILTPRDRLIRVDIGGTKARWSEVWWQNNQRRQAHQSKIRTSWIIVVGIRIRITSRH
jgi:hexokinase